MDVFQRALLDLLEVLYRFPEQFHNVSLHRIREADLGREKSPKKKISTLIGSFLFDSAVLPLFIEIS